jgi:hypothetical protein
LSWSPGAITYPEPPEEVDRRLDGWRRAQGAMKERLRAQPDPTELIVIDEADRLKRVGPQNNVVLLGLSS